MVEDAKLEYLACTRLEKPLVALRIVKKIRQARGRFLKFDKKSGLWNDVGDKKAREKTSQALREQAPEIRKTMDIGGQNRWESEEFEQAIQDSAGSPDTFNHVLNSIDGGEEAASGGEADFVDFRTGLFPNSDPLDTADLFDFSEPSLPKRTGTSTGGWSHRDHSLALNPLPHTTTKVAAEEEWVQDSVPQKQVSKRATSHQNENAETKRGYNDTESSVKRASINLEDRMSSLDLDSLGTSFVPRGEQERLCSADLLELAEPSNVTQI